jgi:hypothetical protein
MKRRSYRGQSIRTLNYDDGGGDDDDDDGNNCKN